MGKSKVEKNVPSSKGKTVDKNTQVMLKYLLGAEWTVLVDFEESLVKNPKSLKGSFYLGCRLLQWCFGGFLCGKEILLSLGCLKTSSRRGTTQNPWRRSISNFDIIFLILWGDKGSISGWKSRKKKNDLRKKRRDHLCFLMLQLSS